MKIQNKKIRIFLDMGLNIFAVGFPVAMLQLIVYPYISRKTDTDSYGLMITMYSVWMVISNSFGNVLNNIRLLHQNQYEEQNITGDFNILLRRWGIINLVFVLILTLYYVQQFNITDIIFSLLIATFVLLKAYLEVGFRIKLNYRSILINGLLQGTGFLLGVLAFSKTGKWQFVFLFGFLFSMTYSAVRTKLLSEPYIRTKLYGTISKSTIQYTIATFSSSMMSYADKMVLYPLMGGHAVSVYYTATILGKIVSMLTGPITSVVLSYISKWNQKNRKIFSKVLFSGTLLAVLGYFVTLFISRPVIAFLFPQWVQEVMKLLPFTTAAIVIQALNAFLNPFVLKFYDIKWQIVINVSSVGIYFVGALVLWYFYGIIGFCVGTICGQLIKTVIMVALHLTNQNSRQKKE